MGTNNYRVCHERGPWWEVICLKRTIQLKELAGKAADFEKRLLEKWQKVPEYKNPAMPPDLSAHFNIGLSPQDADYVPIPDSWIPPADVVPSDFDARIYATQNATTMRDRGRPRKVEGELSRSALWRRRQKDKQGVLI